MIDLPGIEAPVQDGAFRNNHQDQNRFSSDSLLHAHYFRRHVQKWNHRKDVGRVKGLLNASSEGAVSRVECVLRSLGSGGELDLIKRGDSGVLASVFRGRVTGSLAESGLQSRLGSSI